MIPPHRIWHPPRWIISVLRAVSRVTMGAPAVAITIGFTIVVLDRAAFGEDNYAHELEHVRQAVRHGRLGFWARYLVEYARRGYRRNRFEVEARRAAGQE